MCAWQLAAGLHCREAPLPGGWQRPPENGVMCCLVMTLPWVHDSQPQSGSVLVPLPSLSEVAFLFSSGFWGGTGEEA